MTQSTDLVVFDKTYTPAALFVPGAADPLIDRIRAAVKAEVADPSTEAGRKRIVSLAFKVTKTKTAIDDARKTLVADEKKRLAAIDAEGRRIWNELEALAVEVRQPVTEWENRDKARIAAHEAGIAAIQALTTIGLDTATDEIAARLEKAQAVDVGGFEEFTQRAEMMKTQAVRFLSGRLEAARKAEAERAELERLRKEAAERERREREERIAAQARAEAEAAARRREEEAARVAEEERQRLQREAEARERAAAEEIARREREKAEAEARAARAEAERIEAERRAKEAAEQAERDRQEAARRAEEARIAAELAAAERERARIEAERRAEVEAAAKREADRAHRGAVNNAAMAALVEAGLADDAARLAVVTIAKGLVPNVRISY